MNIGEAPINERLLDSSGNLNGVWNQELTKVFDAMSGEWTNGKWSIPVTNGDNAINQNLNIRGTLMSFSFEWLNPIFSSSSMTLPFPVFPGVLQLWDNSGVSSVGALAEGTTLNLPDGVYTGRVFLMGSLHIQEVN